MTAVNVDNSGAFVIPSLSERRAAALAGRRISNARVEATTEPNMVFYGIMLIVSVFVAIGLVMVLSASSIVSVNSGGSAFTMFFKQLKIGRAHV